MLVVSSMLSSVDMQTGSTGPDGWLMHPQGKDGQTARGARGAAGAGAHPVGRLCQVARHVPPVPPPRPPLWLTATGTSKAAACSAAELVQEQMCECPPQRDGTALPQRQEMASGQGALPERCNAFALRI